MKKEEKKGGAYRQMLLEQQQQKRINTIEEETETVSFFRIKFYIAICLLLAYAILDYTEVSFYNCDSEMILSEIEKNINFEFDVEEIVTEVVNVWSEQSI